MLWLLLVLLLCRPRCQFRLVFANFVYLCLGIQISAATSPLLVLFTNQLVVCLCPFDLSATYASRGIARSLSSLCQLCQLVSRLHLKIAQAHVVAAAAQSQSASVARSADRGRISKTSNFMQQSFLEWDKKLCLSSRLFLIKKNCFLTHLY